MIPAPLCLPNVSIVLAVCQHRSTDAGSTEQPWHGLFHVQIDTKKALSFCLRLPTELSGYVLRIERKPDHAPEANSPC